jgi:hypothetical protein
MIAQTLFDLLLRHVVYITKHFHFRMGGVVSRNPK